jgi:hypothetical protein
MHRACCANVLDVAGKINLRIAPLDCVDGGCAIVGSHGRELFPPIDISSKRSIPLRCRSFAQRSMKGSFQ